jgi:DNA-binding beta-propeller fold protein YncE
MKKLASRRSALVAAFTLLVGALLLAQAWLQNIAHAQARAMVEAPKFEVDPLWPKPLPNHWVLGMVIGVWVDDQDHVWIIHRGRDTLHANERALELKVGECCAAAPPVLVFDPAGNLVRAWGGPSTTGEAYEWPQSNHGIHVDHKGFVWIGGNGEKDAHLLKFTKEGKFLLQVGKLGANNGSNDPNNFGRVAKIWVDPKTNEAYVADGYKNKRVAVLDAETGKMKRFWGAYGNKPDDADLGKYDPAAAPPKQFRNPVHCVERSNDGLVYVCDRQADRIQVFQPDGTFVREAHFAKATLGSGSAWDLAFSKDAQQKYIYLADGTNEVVRVILRETLTEITNFGDGGRQPGQFYGVHSIATDSKGHIYTTETYEGKRLQRFVFKGVQQVAAGNQGTPWPAR